MAWFFLFIAGVFEIGWAIGMKYTQGFTKLVPSVITLVSMALSVYLLSLATKEIPIGTAYAVWTGIGIAGTSILGVILFDETVEVLKVVFISMILIAIVGLKITSN
ncbi:MAG: multidrug efflux SMR transporter [Bacteroidales bacterium]|jgi:quaternary ammonium compound-resistance protein SugE|nr:multidrug efflux SMR transporter [Bacteroidales bacterium]